MHRIQIGVAPVKQDKRSIIALPQPRRIIFVPFRQHTDTVLFGKLKLGFAHAQRVRTVKSLYQTLGKPRYTLRKVSSMAENLCRTACRLQQITRTDQAQTAYLGQGQRIEYLFIHLNKGKKFHKVPCCRPVSRRQRKRFPRSTGEPASGRANGRYPDKRHI